ncbi:FGGY-family carbohydrate kinase [bacterium]|nr:FGGY-family carbohydrate kinase [bacterium]
MTPAVLIGIDIGTTFLKTAAFDADSGECIASAGDRLNVRTDGGGVREQNSAKLLESLFHGLDRLRQALGERWREIAGIGVAAQGGSGMLVNRNTGEACTPMLLWNDLRGAEYRDEIIRQAPTGYWKGLSLWEGPAPGLGRIRWFENHCPERFTPDTLYCGAGEYVFFHLTGEWRQDAGNALQIGCYDVRSRDLAERPLQLIGRSLDFVAPLRKGHEIHGLLKQAEERLRLPSGVQVAGPYMDHEAGFLSTYGHSERPFQVSLGTAWVGNYLSQAAQALPGAVPLALPSPVGDCFQMTQAARVGSLTWEWALGCLLDPDLGKAVSRAEALFAERLLPAEGLACLPRFTRPNPLAPQTVGAGGFFGLGPGTTRDEMARAVAAGLVFEFGRIFRPLAASGEVDAVYLSGGASGGEYFRRLFAALFDGLPVYRVTEEAPGARAVLYPFNPDVAHARVERVGSVPDDIRQDFEKGLSLYVKIAERLYD